MKKIKKHEGLIATVSGCIAMVNITLAGYACHIGIHDGDKVIGYIGYFAGLLTLAMTMFIAPVIEKHIKESVVPDEEDLEQWNH